VRCGKVKPKHENIKFSHILDPSGIWMGPPGKCFSL
jgi:hypothetical protein